MTGSVGSGLARHGLLASIVVGVVGAVVGGVVVPAIGTGELFELNILGAIVVIVAVALLIVTVEKGRRTSRGR